MLRAGEGFVKSWLIYVNLVDFRGTLLYIGKTDVRSEHEEDRSYRR